MASLAGIYGGFGTNQEDGSGGRNILVRFKRDVIKEQIKEHNKAGGGGQQQTAASAAAAQAAADESAGIFGGRKFSQGE